MSIKIVVQRYIRGEGTHSKIFSVDDGVELESGVDPLEKAMKYDAHLKKRQEKALKRHYQELKPSDAGLDHSRTSILSIRIGWSIQWSSAQQQYRYYPKICILPYVKGKQTVTAIHITKEESIKDGWWRAIDKYAELRGMSSKERGALKRRKAPTSEQFDKARLYLNRRYGHKIPKHKVPV